MTLFVSTSCPEDPFAIFTCGEAFKKAFLKSGQLRMVPSGSLMYHRSVVPLMIKWKALHFMMGVSSKVHLSSEAVEVLCRIAPPVIVRDFGEHEVI